MWEPRELSSSSRLAVAEALWQAHGVKFGKFTLASGQQSTYFVNFKLLQSYPEHEGPVVDAFVEQLADIGVDRIVGIPDGGTGLAAIVGTRLGIGRLQLRKEVKDHGADPGKWVEGGYEAGMTVCVLEDVVTTGGSILDKIAKLKAVGLKVIHIAFGVDRLQGGVKNMEVAGYESVSSLVTVVDAFRYYMEQGYVEDEWVGKVNELIAELTAT